MYKFLHRFNRTDYMIAYRFINSEDGLLNNNSKPFKVFKNNHTYWYADPILYKFDKKIYMFYEAYNKKENCGEIGVATIIDNSIVNQQIIIKEPFHMSYPFVFNINNKIYMIPETSSAKKLLLYESVDFPAKWKLKKVLMDNIEFSDATILNSENKIFIFVSHLLCDIPYHDELFLYTLDNELNLIPHKRNPIMTDNKITRPAGRIFEHNGKLIRVSQDCSNGDYGKALKFNEIINISDDEYLEKNISTVLPKNIPIKFHKRLTGTHTYGVCDDFEVIDVRFSRLDLKKLLTFLFQLPYKMIKKSITVAIK